jgi:hypothetical protein
VLAQRPADVGLAAFPFERMVLEPRHQIGIVPVAKKGIQGIGKSTAMIEGPRNARS